MRQRRWLDVLKDYDCEILYHPGKANMVADALSRKVAGSSIGNVCLRMTVISPLLDMISPLSRKADSKPISFVH